MDIPAYAPFAAVAVGFFFLIVGYRSILKREVIDSAGNVRTTRNIGYYLLTAVYLLLGMLLLTLSTVLFYNLYGFGSLALVLVVFLLVAGAMYRLRTWRNQFRNYLDVKLSSPRKLNQVTAESWALAAVGPIAQVNGQDFHSLGGISLNDFNRNMAKRKLAREWEVPNQEAYLELMDWLFETGHRAEFHALVDRVTRMEADALDQFRESLQAGKEGVTDAQEIEEMMHRVDMIRTNQGQVNQQGFMAWDLIRFLDLSRWGFLAGYLSESEAKERMFTASQVLQARFENWEELYRNYFLGMEFWSVVEMRRDGQTLKRATERFLKDEKGPWTRVPWSINLRPASK